MLLSQVLDRFKIDPERDIAKNLAIVSDVSIGINGNLPEGCPACGKPENAIGHMIEKIPCVEGFWVENCVFSGKLIVYSKNMDGKDGYLYSVKRIRVFKSFHSEVNATSKCNAPVPMIEQLLQ